MMDGLDGQLVLDGATGTELARRGVDVEGPLWSAAAMLEAPEVLEAVHRSYVEAGADLITANTFRVSGPALAAAGLESRHAELAGEAVAIARRACAAAGRPEVRVLGSVAPLGDCYDVSVKPTARACREEHARSIAVLREAGVDGVVLETMPWVAEAAFAARAAERLMPGRWWLSVVGDAGRPGRTLSGESMLELGPLPGGAAAIGAN